MATPSSQNSDTISTHVPVSDTKVTHVPVSDTIINVDDTNIHEQLKRLGIDEETIRKQNPDKIKMAKQYDHKTITR